MWHNLIPIVPDIFIFLEIKQSCLAAIHAHLSSFSSVATYEHDEATLSFRRGGRLP